jgi:hypothetical protein
MIDLDNFLWNKLSIICYKGGYGGDFLCNLLYQNYNEKHLVSPKTKENQFDFTLLDAGYTHPCLKNIKDLFSLHKDSKNKFNSIKLTEFDRIEIKKNNSKKLIKEIFDYEDLLKIYNILYDEDPNIYAENVSHYLRDIFYKGYKEKKYIARMHWHHPTYDNFQLSKVFPGANVFLLVTDNMIYHNFFTLLTFVKNNQMYYYKLLNDSTFIDMFTDEKKVVKNSFDNMIPLDVGKLFFEDEYEKNIEEILSDTLQKKIILNRQLLQKYKKNNMTIIENIIGKENMKNHTPSLILEKVGIFLNERYNKL